MTRAAGLTNFYRLLDDLALQQGGRKRLAEMRRSLPQCGVYFVFDQKEK